MSCNLKSFLHSAPYKSQENGQTEQYNRINWKTIFSWLITNNLGVSHWENALQESLIASRSLLCTSTNATPHETMFHHPRRMNSETALPTFSTTSDRSCSTEKISKQ